MRSTKGFYKRDAVADIKCYARVSSVFQVVRTPDADSIKLEITTHQQMGQFTTFLDRTEALRLAMEILETIHKQDTPEKSKF